MIGSSPRPAATCWRCTSRYHAVTAPRAAASLWAACCITTQPSVRKWCEKPAPTCLRCTSLYYAVTAPTAAASSWAACLMHTHVSLKDYIP